MRADTRQPALIARNLRRFTTPLYNTNGGPAGLIGFGGNGGNAGLGATPATPGAGGTLLGPAGNNGLSYTRMR